MGRFLAGVASALLLVLGGLMWGRSADDGGERAIAAASVAPVSVDELGNMASPGIGPAPPEPPQSTPQTREEQRFARYDRDEDDAITRREMMGSRTAAFRRLDTDRDNYLTFEEWAVATGERFAGADRDGSGALTRAEFATTRQSSSSRPACRC
ncbi:MAG: hypothetical protein H7X93_13545 [Sphingomonadaceae bacterium]|nr:hypothetical protein [Sphingomonadaceae bacterium]